MNLKRTLSITAATISSLIASNVSNADFCGLSVDTIDSGLGIGLTHRVYVHVDAGDQVNAIFGDTESAIDIHPETGSFYQNMFGYPSPPDEALFDFFPSVEYDSFVTIGRLTNTDNAMLYMGIDWTDFETNGGAIFADNGGWFAAPGDSQTYEVDGRVLIAQFTGAMPYGDFTIQGRNADFTTWQHHYNSWVCWADSDEDGVNNCCDNCYLYNPDQADCNINGIGDVCDFADGTSGDWNEDGIPDECQSLADIDDDGEVTVLDLVLVISNWGQIGDPGILGDATWDGTVNNNDLLEVISAWGIIYPLDETGGCCIDQTCDILLLAECLAAGGFHLGVDTDCSKETCVPDVPDAPDCDNDLNGDGYIDLIELIILISNWGECPGPKCSGDFDGDGIVNINDLMYLFSLNWDVLCE